MLVYYSVLVFILLAAICSSLAKKGIYKDLFFQIAAFLLFLVMAIRDESVGTDLPKYLDIVNTIGYSNFSDFLSDSLSFPGYEFGWIISSDFWFRKNAIGNQFGLLYLFILSIILSLFYVAFFKPRYFHT